MKDFGDRLDEALRIEVAQGTPAGLLVTGLVNQLARVLVGVHKTGGDDLEGLTEIVRHQLDEAVVFYASRRV